MVTNTGEPDKSVIEDAVRKCLDHADDYGITSLSLPAVGTGHLKKDAKQSAEILYSCIKEYRKRKQKKLKLIRIVILQENVYADFKKAFPGEDAPMSPTSKGKTTQYNPTQPSPHI
jgi:O-acetyl-ADP-ribose deacetylase (regulator of RNase III)